MTTVAPARPAAQAARPPAGAARLSKMWLDDKGLPHTSAEEVPVDQDDRRTAHVWHLCSKGEIVVGLSDGTEERRPCDQGKWLLPDDKAAFCPDHGSPMTPAQEQGPRIPLDKVVAAAEASFRPWWILGAEAAAGAALHAAEVSTLAPAAVTPVLAAAGYGAVRLELTRRAVKRGRIDKGQKSGRRVRLIARRARYAGWLSGAAGAWLTAAASVDPSTLTGKVVWASLPPLWALASVPWWRYLEVRRNAQPEPEPEIVAEPEPVEYVPSDDERDALAAAEAWRTEVGAADTVLDHLTWKRIPCGWQAVVKATKRGALVRMSGDIRAFQARIAAAFDVPRSAVTWVEEHDENPNMAMLYIQAINPLKEGQLWPGPESIRITDKRIEYDGGRLIDGKPMVETLYLFNWGAPSALDLGTTGGGKSMRARKRMVVERWASYEDPVTGQRKGLFLTFLHDPKRLESYGEFRDAIHGYGMTRDDAHIMVDAFLRECMRRYDMLRDQVWYDVRNGKRRKRRGGVKWNPMVHGPILSTYWDEFHELAGDQEFVKKLEKLARYQRAGALRAHLLSHMGTIGDTGSQALRDMLAGGRATLFRTTSGLNAPLATGGQLTGDPRALPKLPGMCYVADGETAALMGRESWIPGTEEEAAMAGTDKTLYDWLFDDDNNPIGYPAEIPPETVEAFGPEFMEWMAAGRRDEGREGWVYSGTPAFVPTEEKSAADAVVAILSKADRPLQRSEITADPLWGDRSKTSTLTKALRDCLDADPPLVVKTQQGKDVFYTPSPAVQARSVEAEQERQMEMDLEAAA